MMEIALVTAWSLPETGEEFFLLPESAMDIDSGLFVPKSGILADDGAYNARRIEWKRAIPSRSARFPAIAIAGDSLASPSAPSNRGSQEVSSNLEHDIRAVCERYGKRLEFGTFRVSGQMFTVTGK